MAAPFTLRKIGVPLNSANLTEARRRVFDFFRAACRSIPTIMDIYNLQDVVAPSQLRFAISAQIRNNAHITDPKVIDLLLLVKVWCRIQEARTREEEDNGAKLKKSSAEEADG